MIISRIICPGPGMNNKRPALDPFLGRASVESVQLQEKSPAATRGTFNRNAQRSSKIRMMMGIGIPTSQSRMGM
jgi:hypothetical protein